MSRSPRFLLAIGVGTLLTASALAQTPSFTPIPGAFGASDITPDGEIVVGSGSGGGYFWRWRVDPSPTFIGGNDAVAISDDGSVIAGNINDPVTGAEVAARWTLATGWVSIGALPNALQCPSLSSAYDMTGDGNFIVGLSWDGCSGRGFLYDHNLGFMLELLNLGNGQNRASAIAADGSLIGGFAQGTFSRTPAIWEPTTIGSLYDIDQIGEVAGIDDTGGVTVGTYNSGAFYKIGPAPIVGLGSFLPGNNATAMDVSEGLTRICGFDFFLQSRTAWIWTPGIGFEGLAAKLGSLGVTPPASGLGVAIKMTPDGEVIIGQTFFGGAWIVELPLGASTAFCFGDGSGTPCPCGNLGAPGQGCANSSGNGGVLANGGTSSVALDNLTFQASHLLPNQPALLFSGGAAPNGGNGLPFGDGLRCVGTNLIRLGVQTPGGGGTASWGPGLVGGTGYAAGDTRYFQVWYRDPSGSPCGLAFNLTNGVELTFAP